MLSIYKTKKNHFYYYNFYIIFYTVILYYICISTLKKKKNIELNTNVYSIPRKFINLKLWDNGIYLIPPF